MSSESRGTVLRSLQTLLTIGPVAGMSDAQLLDQFVGQSQEASETAFTALVKLHGPMVWNVCRSILSDTHDAEDAFQATFLLLVRKANTVRRRDTLAPWLYGVARRIAVRAKERRKHRPLPPNEDVEAITAIPDHELREQHELLHQELDRLPEKYRAVIVLCHLEGRTQAETARLLGCPVSTIGVRITRGRNLLRARLTQRGLATPSIMTGLALPSSAPVVLSPAPSSLMTSTINAALRLSVNKSLAAGSIPTAVSNLIEGALRPMLSTKLAIASSSILALGLISGGIGWVAMGDGPSKLKPTVLQSKASKSEVDSPRAVAVQDEADSPPKGWGGGGEGYQLVRDGTIKHRGNASGRITSGGQGSNGFGTFTQGINAEKYRGKRLRLSGYVKSSKLLGKAGLWMRIDGKTKSPLGFDNMMNRSVSGTTDWKQYHVVLDIPDDAEAIFFGFLMAGRGSAWVDDMELESVGKDVKSTDLKLRATNQATNGGFVLPTDTENLDFEN